MLARLPFVAQRPALRALPSTAAELERTKPHHDETIKRADELLNDFRRFDGALRVVSTKR